MAKSSGGSFRAPHLPKPAPIKSGSAGHAGAPVGSSAHKAAHAGFRSKLEEIETDRGSFSFKKNRGGRD
jgi:hypothetical protein